MVHGVTARPEATLPVPWSSLLGLCVDGTAWTVGRTREPVFARARDLGALARTLYRDALVYVERGFSEAVRATAAGARTPTTRPRCQTRYCDTFMASTAWAQKRRYRPGARLSIRARVATTTTARRAPNAIPVECSVVGVLHSTPRPKTGLFRAHRVQNSTRRRRAHSHRLPNTHAPREPGRERAPLWLPNSALAAPGGALLAAEGWERLVLRFDKISPAKQLRRPPAPQRACELISRPFAAAMAWIPAVLLRARPGHVATTTTRKSRRSMRSRASGIGSKVVDLRIIAHGSKVLREFGNVRRHRGGERDPW